MAIYLLDTNILTELFKGHSKVVSHIQKLPDDTRIATTVVGRYEVLRGRFEFLLKAATPSELLRANELIRLDDTHLANFDIVDVSEEVARQFEILCANKKLKNQKIGRGDLLNACITLAHNAILVTRNTKDFVNIPNLKIENWLG